MRFRKLRIAWSVVWGIACISLIALWVRSNYWIDQVLVPVTHSAYVALGSMPNAFGVGLTHKSPTGTWAMLNMPTIDWLIALGESGDSWSGASCFKMAAGAIMMPYWFGVLLAAAFATAPWLCWRFTLRTLLIAMTAVPSCLL
jgi:hypothetical protein